MVEPRSSVAATESEEDAGWSQLPAEPVKAVKTGSGMPWRCCAPREFRACGSKSSPAKSKSPKAASTGTFDDLADLHQSILDYWSTEFTEVVTRHSRLEEGDAVEAILQLIHMVREQQLDRYELAMRAWAEHDPNAAEMVERIYRDRMQFVGGLFRQIGFTGTALDARTRLLLCYLSWDPNMMTDEDDASRELIADEIHRLLTLT